jgi:hypothetical protein
MLIIGCDYHWSGKGLRTARSAGSSAPANRSSRIIFETRLTNSACGADWSWPLYVASHGRKNWPDADGVPAPYPQAVGAD